MPDPQRDRSNHPHGVLGLNRSAIAAADLRHPPGLPAANGSWGR
jgi:hypothetical protein